MMTNKMLATVLGVGFGLVLAVGNTGCGSAPKPPATPDTAAATGGGDSDGDGVPDGTDKCPDKKEDGAAPDPKDGCPKA
jgi:hypothetical protein